MSSAQTFTLRNPSTNLRVSVYSNRDSMTSMYYSSPSSLRFRSLLRLSSGVRSLSVSVSGYLVVFDRRLVLCRSNSRSRFSFPIAASRFGFDIEEEMSRLNDEIEEIRRMEDDMIKKVNCVKYEIGENTSYHKVETVVSEEAGKQTVVSETIKVGKSREVFEVYYKKTTIISKETPAKMKTRADKTRKDLNVITMEPSEDGKVYASVAGEDSPETKKDIVKRSASSTDNLKDFFKVDGFYVGIPYSALLSFSGFLSFMITGSISATRFNVVLGGTFLALSMCGLRSRRTRKSSAIAMNGQAGTVDSAAIVTLLFLRQIRSLLMMPKFTNFLATLVSGAVMSAYISRLLYSIKQAKGEPSLDAGAED